MKYIKPIFARDYNFFDIIYFSSSAAVLLNDHILEAIMIMIAGIVISTIGEIYTKA